jgi:hypothetical protein
MIRAQIYAHKDDNKFDRRGYIYCWYYRVYNTDTGNVLASDNTGDFGKMFDSAMRDLKAISHCAQLGVLKKSRGW